MIMMKWFAKRKSEQTSYEHLDHPDNVGVIISADGRTLEVNANGQRVLFISNAQQLFIRDNLTGMSYFKNLRLE